MKFVISHGAKSYQVEKDAPVSGKKIGDMLEGSLLGLDGYKLIITGGSDKAGFPMNKDVEGQGKKRMLVYPGFGFGGLKKIKKLKFRHEGMQRRKSMRGNAVSDETTQINCKVVEAGARPLAEYAPATGKKEEKG